MPETSPLVEALRGIQSANGWTDQRMAVEMGITRQQWAYLRDGEQQPGVQTLRKIASSFPALREAVRSFVAPDATKVAVTHAPVAEVA